MIPCIYEYTQVYAIKISLFIMAGVTTTVTNILILEIKGT
jgi:hypothetical protein